MMEGSWRAVGSWLGVLWLQVGHGERATQSLNHVVVWHLRDPMRRESRIEQLGTAWRSKFNERFVWHSQSCWICDRSTMHLEFTFLPSMTPIVRLRTFLALYQGSCITENRQRR
jgi:hypothetical protein